MHILGLHRIDFLNSLFLVMGKNIPWWRSRLSGISLETPAQWVSVLRLPQLNVSCYCCWCCSCDSWQQNFDTKCEICPSVTGEISSCSRGILFGARRWGMSWHTCSWCEYNGIACRNAASNNDKHISQLSPSHFWSLSACLPFRVGQLYTFGSLFIASHPGSGAKVYASAISWSRATFRKFAKVGWA